MFGPAAGFDPLNGDPLRRADDWFGADVKKMKARRPAPER